MSVTAASGARKSTNSEMPPSKRNDLASCGSSPRSSRDDDRRAPARGTRSGARGRAARRVWKSAPFVKICAVGPVPDAGAGDALGDLADDAQLAARLERRERRIRRRLARVGEDAGLAAVERHRPGLAVAVDLDVEPLGERVDDGGADAVQAAGCRVRAAAELAAGVQLGEDDLDAGQPGLAARCRPGCRAPCRAPRRCRRGAGRRRSRVPCPPSASSTELSMISQRQCMSPRESVEPMYMPGRLRTASSPSSTWRWRAEYSAVTILKRIRGAPTDATARTRVATDRAYAHSEMSRGSRHSRNKRVVVFITRTGVHYDAYEEAPR